MQRQVQICCLGTMSLRKSSGWFGIMTQTCHILICKRFEPQMLATDWS